MGIVTGAVMSFEEKREKNREQTNADI